MIPGLGTIAHLGQFQAGTPTQPPYGSGGMINDHGQVLFNVTLTDGRGVMLVASPTLG